MINSMRLLTRELEQMALRPIYVPVNEKKRVKIFGVELAYLYLFGIGTAFVGWLAENLARLFTQGIWDCRFHLLPFISPYALIPFAFQILLGDPDSIAFFGHKAFKKENKRTAVLSNLLCISLICGAVFAGELAVGICGRGASAWSCGIIPISLCRLRSMRGLCRRLRTAEGLI